jgi:hypothetical protein
MHNLAKLAQFAGKGKMRRVFRHTSNNFADHLNCLLEATDFAIDEKP